MHLPTKSSYLTKTLQRFSIVRCTLVSLAVFLLSISSSAQTCPANIDFEQGSFNGWTCYVGNTASVSGENVISLVNNNGPSADRHKLYAANTGELDPFGNFPVTCPNGSGYSVKLGNNMGGGEAEGISYEFTIPANQNYYSLIYYYAVVFEAPNHRVSEQPRMEIEVMNLTDNVPIECASFTFIASGSSLPGFQYSNNAVDTTSVLYKTWSPVSVDLSGNAGKRIRLFFKTADCTFRKHFGYAYIDVNTECSGSFTGATYCPDDTAINVVGPYGFQHYTWYDSSMTNILGNQQILNLSPPPPAGTTVAVKVEPYAGYGCSQVFYALLKDTLSVQANAGFDALICNKTGAQIGTRPTPGLVYSWSPSAGLSSAASSNPTANPDSNTTYIVKTTSSGGGCLARDTVAVRTSIINNAMQVIGRTDWCITQNDSAILQVQPTEKIQWVKNNLPINGAINPKYRVTSTGNYHAVLTNRDGCSLSTADQPINIEIPTRPMAYPVQYAVVNYPLTLKARTFGQTVQWNPPLNLNNPNTVSPIFNGVRDQLYTITITTRGGCITVDTQLVKAIKQVEVFVPTAFTPNSDGKNDLLRPILLGIKETRYFRIYNRWGQVVFESKDPAQGWNGRLNGQPASMQTLVWMYEGLGLDNRIYNQKGTTILMR